jgi:hypothetical protein
MRWDLSRPVAMELKAQKKRDEKTERGHFSRRAATLWRQKEKLRKGTDARCVKMLEQALSGSESADVEFVFGEGGGQHQGSV